MSLPVEEQFDDTWEYVGDAPVDAGLVMICDPGYLAVDECDDVAERDANNPLRNWHEFLTDQVFPENLVTGDERAAVVARDKRGFGFGVVVGRFGGDGSFPVHILKDRDGMVRAAMVVFDPPEESEDEDESDESYGCEFCRLYDGHLAGCPDSDSYQDADDGLLVTR